MAQDYHWVLEVKKLGIHDRRRCDESIDVNATEAESEASIVVKRQCETKRIRAREEIEAAEWLARAGGTAPDMQCIPRRLSNVSE